jgi:hypothetical protein
MMQFLSDTLSVRPSLVSAFANRLEGTENQTLQEIMERSVRMQSIDAPSQAAVSAMPRTFLPTLTTTVLCRSSSGWFETCC